MVAATLLTLATASRVSIRLAVTVCIDTFSVNKAESAAIIGCSFLANFNEFESAMQLLILCLASLSQ